MNLSLQAIALILLGLFLIGLVIDLKTPQKAIDEFISDPGNVYIPTAIVLPVDVGFFIFAVNVFSALAKIVN